jgi:flavodoxin
MKALILVSSYHHKNTEKVAHAMAEVLDARVSSPDQVEPGEVGEYDLVGFGSGIYSSKHHPSLLELAEGLPMTGEDGATRPGRAFLFSTCGVPAFAFPSADIKSYLEKIHSPTREILESKGWVILDEFICPGFNTNSFLKLFGGINRGRPDDSDLQAAREFARSLIERSKGDV